MAKQISIHNRTYQGLYVLVDDADYAELNKYRWMLSSRGYAMAKIDGCTVQMHRMIMSCPEGYEIDHVDHQPLNNQRSNLRIVTHAQNLHNRDKNRRGSSKYKGVSWNWRINKWTAHCRGVYRGAYESEDDAGRAYDRAAIEEYGEYARLNFPDEAPLLSMSDADWMDEIRDATQLAPNELAAAIHGTQRKGRAA